MVCLVINGDTLKSAEKFVDKLVQIPGMTSISVCINKKQTNVIMGDTVKVLWGQGYITDYIGDIKYQISPFLLSGQPGADREVVRSGTGICRTYR